MAIAKDLSGNCPGGPEHQDPHIGSRNDVPALRPGTTTSLTMSGSSQTLGPFDPATKYLRLATEGQPAHYDVGLAPTASPNENWLPANAVETIKIQYPDKLAVLQGGSAGDINVTEMR